MPRARRATPPALPVLAGLWALLAGAAVAGELPSSERYHYQLFCQGCHGPQGDGYRGVPPLRDFVGYYLDDDEGRAFLLRVPGVANAPLEDAELAELMNWIAARFGGESLPARWRPYTAQEVARHRSRRIARLPQYRAALLARLRPGDPDAPQLP